MSHPLPQGRSEPAAPRPRKREQDIFVLYGTSLIAPGIEALLRERGFKVIGVNVLRPNTLEQMGPIGARDIVIVDTADEAVHPQLSILNIVLPRRKVLVIGLDAQHNRMEVYRKRQKKVHHLNDLVNVLSGQ